MPDGYHYDFIAYSVSVLSIFSAGASTDHHSPRSQALAHCTRVKRSSDLKKASPFPFRLSAPASSIITLLSEPLLTLRASCVGRFERKLVLITSALGFCVAIRHRPLLE
jgi:hypothetical protein